MENQVAYTTIDEYIAIFPADLQVVLRKMRQTIKEAAPQSVERISYQMPSFYTGRALVHFAVQKKHIGFYPGASGVEVFKDKLTDYKTSKGAIQFPKDKEIPYELITEIVKYRVKENDDLARSKKK